MVNAQTQDPLLPGYSFNAYLVAGFTPIDKGGLYDFFIDRPNGMEGYIINLTVSGEVVIYHQDQSLLTKPGDFLVFPSEEPHYYGRRPVSSQWYHYWVYFKPRALWTKWLEWPLSIGKIGFFLPDSSSLRQFQNLFIHIVETAQSATIYSELLAMNLLENLLLQRMELISKSHPPNYDSRVMAVCDYISEHLEKFIPGESLLKRVSDYVHLSPSRISHLFKKNIGVGILAWREDQRINKAKFLLQTTPLSISQISQQLGYSDQFYFSRMFKNKTGLSPKKFRLIFYKSN